MGLYRDLKADFEHDDDRGKLVQLVHDGFAQVNLLYSKKGAFRGGHYHKVAHEAFYVVSGNVDMEFSRDGEHVHRHFEEGDFFLIEPYVAHSMAYHADCVMLGMYDVPVESEDGTKDIYEAKM